jgi:hypothetical protein
MVVVAVLVLLGGAAPAAAEFTTNEIGCAGSAVITGDDGSTVTVDAADAKATVPSGGSAAYQGSVGTVTHHHSGSIDVAVGPASVELGSWSSANDGNESTKAGTKELPAALGDLPPGKYELTGSHQGDEGRCAGRMTLEVAGSIVGSPISAGTSVLALIGLALLVLGVVRGSPVLGLFGGLLFGLFGGMDLVFLRAVGSGSILLVVLPILLAVVGVAAGFLRLRTGGGGGGAAPAAPSV